MPTCARAARLPGGETFNFRSFPIISVVRAGGFTLILAWIPASAGMTEAGGFTLILAWIPASAGMTEAGASPSSSPGFQPPLE